MLNDRDSGTGTPGGTAVRLRLMQGATRGSPARRSRTVQGVANPGCYRDRTADVADAPDLHGRTDPEKTTISTPAATGEHVEAIERLRRAEATSDAIPYRNGWQNRLAAKRRFS